MIDDAHDACCDVMMFAGMIRRCPTKVLEYGFIYLNNEKCMHECDLGTIDGNQFHNFMCTS